ncbi:MAG TPA: hypothetical protein HA286_01710, partial [Candidatus Poseidoniaceae archaeon]|nr:hypothetical protein [Candidatus Poseidoniaceae archaeon]
MAKRGAAALLALLMCSMSLATVSADTLHAVHDEAVLVVTGEAGSTWSGNLSLDAEQRGLFVTSCGSCHAEVSDEAGSVQANGTGGLHFTILPEAATEMTLTVTFIEDETATVLLLGSSMEEAQHRPVPGEV